MTAGLRKNSARVPTLVVAALAALFLLPRLLSGALRHWDEAWYAEVSREMLAAGSWTTPLWNGEPWFHKPPLAFWATAVSFWLFGVGETSARLFSYSCTVAHVGLVVGFVGGQSKRFSFEHAPWIGAVAGLLLLAIPEFVRYGARGQLDGPLALFLTVQLVAFWRAPGDGRWRLVEGIAFALAIMTKGAAAGLAVAVELSFLPFARDWRRYADRRWLLALAAGTALALPWHLMMWRMHGERFLRDYGLRHFAQFFAEINEPTTSTAPPKPAYYLDFLLRKQPWWGWIILFLACVAAIHLAQCVHARIRSTLRGNAEQARYEWMSFLACWALVIPIGLSLSRAKWSWYLVPMYPAYAAYAATLLARTTHWRWRAATVAAFALATVVAIEGIAAPANELGEAEIRALTPIVQELVPADRFLYCLQVERASESVYPIACAFYFQRTMHTLHGLEHFRAIVERPGQPPFILVAHRRLIETVERPSWRAIALANQGRFAAFRIEPWQSATPRS